MNRLLLLVPLLAASARAAAPAPSLSAFVRANAASLGAPVPEGFEFAPVLVPDPARRGNVSGSGYISGAGSLWCSARADRPNDTGFFSGVVYLAGDIRVSGPSGASGLARVSGTVLLTGPCRFGGSGYASGSARFEGRATLYKDGRSVGTARVDGQQFLSRYVHGGLAHFTDYVSVSGYLQ